MIVDALDVLVSAWCEWEQHPRAAEAAAAMEDACVPVAADLGVTTSTLRSRLTAARREGHDIPAVVKALRS